MKIVAYNPKSNKEIYEIVLKMRSEINDIILLNELAIDNRLSIVSRILFDYLDELKDKNV